MARFLRAFFVLAAALCPSIASAATQHIDWGFESWQCGQSWFGIQIGNGSPVYITSISGVISASALPHSHSGTVNNSSTDTTQVIEFQRQALITLTSDAAIGSSVDGHPFLTPTAPAAQPDRYTQGLDENYFAVDVKQDGWQVVHVPLTYTFPGGIVLPNGQLKALVTAVTYDGTATVDNQPAECIDAETHLTIFYTYTAPTS